MFRIECFVEDRNLASALRGLAGLCKAMDVQPVVNVVEEPPKKGRTKKEPIKARTDGTSLSLFIPYLEKTDGEVTTQFVKNFLTNIGRSPASYQYVLREAIKHKLLTLHKKGRNMTYNRTNT